MSKQIFSGVEGFSGFFQAFSGEDVTITFSRKTTDTNNPAIEQGFLVQQYTAQWQRPVSIERVLNRKKPVAMVGAGVGSLQIQGLVGAAASLEELLQSDEICSPLTAVIKGAASLTNCDDNGKATKESGNLIITLSNVIPQAITITGSAQNQGIMLQSANAQFQFGGFKIG